MPTQPSVAPSTVEEPKSGLRAQMAFQVLVLGLLVLLLVNYKGAAGLSKIQQTRATGSLRLPALQTGTAAVATTAFSNTVAYLKIVWPALVFGVLISAAARTSLSRTPRLTIFGRGNVRDQVTGALAGAPLMLCSCCIAPIFPAVHQRTRKVAPALALTLASPSLNPVALTLSFILFPLRISAARLAMALVLVLVGSVLVARLTSPSVLPATADDEPGDSTWPSLLASYAKSLLHVSRQTVPLILVGIWASMWIMGRLPAQLDTGTGTHILTIVIIALFAVLLTLPTLFEIPLAMLVMAGGGPAGAVAAVLFAGPAINLASLLVIGRYSSWKVAAGLAGVVWVIAATGGLLLN